MSRLLDLLLHLDTHLEGLTRSAGSWTYLILFAFLFAETGFVITPFLPGDSLLFVTGALEAKGTALNLPLTFLVFAAGAILGDSANFEIGKRLGPHLFRGEKHRFLNPKNLERTRAFFDRYGGKAIVLARFVPVIRTFAPFVAGTGEMYYGRFLAYNVVGGLLWVALFLFGGYYFGNIPFIKGHFMIVVGVIVVLSLLPAAYEFWAARRPAPLTQSKRQHNYNEKSRYRFTGDGEEGDAAGSGDAQDRTAFHIEKAAQGGVE